MNKILNYIRSTKHEPILLYVALLSLFIYCLMVSKQPIIPILAGTVFESVAYDERYSAAASNISLSLLAAYFVYFLSVILPRSNDYFVADLEYIRFYKNLMYCYSKWLFCEGMQDKGVQIKNKTSIDLSFFTKNSQYAKCLAFQVYETDEITRQEKLNAYGDSPKEYYNRLRKFYIGGDFSSSDDISGSHYFLIQTEWIMVYSQYLSVERIRLIRNLYECAFAASSFRKDELMPDYEDFDCTKGTNAYMYIILKEVYDIISEMPDTH